MNQMFSGLLSFCVLAALSLNAADLVDKDGRLYRNFRIREVNNGRAAILYNLADGSPEIAYVPLSKLPEELQRQYPAYRNPVPEKPKKWQSGRTLREKLNLAARQLEYDIKQLPAGNQANKRALAHKLSVQLENVLAGYGETADLQLVSAERNGSLVRVVGTGVKSQLRSGQYLYMHQSQFKRNAFRMKIYPAGDVMNHSKYGRIAIYAESTAKAAAAAGDYIAGLVGDNTLFLPPAPPPEPVQRSNEAVSNNVVNNIYYVEDDRRRDRVYYYNDHFNRPPDKRPDRKPGKKPDRHPDKKPDKTPDKTPDKKPEPNHKPGNEPHRERPLVNKKGYEINNYGLLPEWARPGKTGR